MSFNLREFADSLPGIKAEDLLALVPQSLWRKNPEEAAALALRRYGRFDAEKYLEMYADVRDSGMDVFEHYARHGYIENRELCLLHDVSKKPQQIKKSENSKICNINATANHGNNHRNNDKSKTKEEYYDELRLPGANLKDKYLNIGFLLGGGLGDYLIFFNYLDYFCRKFKNESINIETVYDPNKEIASLFLRDKSLSDKIYDHPGTTTYFKNYDLFIQLNRYPEIKIKKLDKIKLFSPDLLEYVFQCEKFKATYPRYFSGYKLDGQSAALCELFGIKRIQQPDIYGLLGITEEYKYKLPVDQEDVGYIHDLGLRENEYITLHRGCDTRYSKNSTKLWPLDYYHALTGMLKKEYPDKKLVQLGVSHERCGTMENVDLNLVESTDLGQVAELLSHSALHIDNEGGLVHLRHALNAGKSIVMFGPTSDKFFSYSENCNLRGNGCTHWCEWLNETWMKGCPQRYYEPPCMLSIVPDMVMENARQILNPGK